MNGIQKGIKYCAMAFAVFLSVVIIGSGVLFLTGMMAGISSASGVLEEKERIQLSEQYTLDEIESLKITGLVIDCNAEIEVRPGTMLSIEATNVTDEYEISCKDGSFSIIQNRPDHYFNPLSWFRDATEREMVVVTIPEEFTPDIVTVRSGSGKISIESLKTNRLMTDSGSGSVTLKNGKAMTSEINSGSGGVAIDEFDLGKCKMDTGSGSVRLHGVVANDMVLDSGSGSVELNGKINGSCAFYTGSGSVSMVLDGREEDYRIIAECGSGTFRVNGEKRDDGGYGTAVVGTLMFDSGSGSVSVDFKGLRD